MSGNTKNGKNQKKVRNTGKRLPAQAHGVGNTSDLQAYKARLAAHRKKSLIRSLVILGIIAVVAFLVVLIIQRKTYGSYKVVSTSEREDTIATKYTELGGKLFKYSPEGATLSDKDSKVVWSATYEMQNPVVDVCDKTAVVADQGGTSMAIFGEKGITGTVETSFNIVKAKVARQGVVAAILDGGEDTWINFYSTDGSLIAENQTRVDDPGYPLDIDVSPDGMLIMVAYQFVDGGETTSYVAYYNFGTAGQNQIDNIVSGYKYEGIVVPQVEYLDNSTSVAFKDNGFTVFNGKQVPKEGAKVEVKEEIVSTFHDDSHIGLVFKNDKKDKMYTMKVYNTNGKLQFEKEFSIAYTQIKMSGGVIVMNNDSQVCVITTQGVEKYNGNIDEGTISDFFKVGMNRYMLVLDSGLCQIKFS